MRIDWHAYVGTFTGTRDTTDHGTVTLTVTFAPAEIPAEIDASTSDHPMISATGLVSSTGQTWRAMGWAWYPPDRALSWASWGLVGSGAAGAEGVDPNGWTSRFEASNESLTDLAGKQVVTQMTATEIFGEPVFGAGAFDLSRVPAP